MYRKNGFSDYRKCELLSDNIEQCLVTLDQLKQYKQALLDLTTQTHEKQKSSEQFYSFIVEIVFIESKIQKLEYHLKLNQNEYTTIADSTESTNI